MPIYFYEATNAEGRIFRGKISAPNQKEVINHLSAKELTPVFIKSKARIKTKKSPVSSLFQRITLLDKAEFASHFAALLKAGVSMARALDILEKGTDKSMMKKLYSELKTDLERGRALNQVLAEKYKKHFPLYFTGLIRAGEESGNLDEILDGLGRDLRKDHALIRKVQSACFYPVLLLCAATSVIIFLIVYIIPKLITAYTQAGVALPAITLAIISVSEFLRSSYLLILGTIALLVAGFVLIKKTKRGEISIAKVILSLPVLGDLFKKVILTRFTRTLAMLLKSGLTIGEALDITSDAAGNSVYKNIILRSKELAVRGIALSNCLKEHPKYFSSMIIGTMAIGEESGRLEEMLLTMSEFYEEEVSRKAEMLTTTIEPVLLIVLGLVVAFIALSVILPIYQFISAF